MMTDVQKKRMAYAKARGKKVDPVEDKKDESPAPEKGKYLDRMAKPQEEK